jgi:hypothetical protein
MKTVLWLIIVTAVPANALAVAPDKFFFLGEVKLSNPQGRPMGSQVLLLEKIHDPDNGAIHENAVVVSADGKADARNMLLTVKEDNTFTLVDDAATVKGEGTLFGPAWEWTYFKATFKATNGVTIEDENYLADKSVGTARKKVIAPDGKAIMFMDMSLKEITPKTFEILKTALLR